MDAHDIAAAVVKAIHENRQSFWVEPQRHSEEHEFIKVLIEDHVEKKARRERIKEKVAGSLVLTSILALVTLLGAGLLDWIRAHLR